MDFQLAFEALPGNFILLAPDPPRYPILGVSEEMLRLTSRRRQDVVGKGVFEVFPQNPAAFPATGSESLRNSLQAAIATKGPDQMALVRYDIPDGQGNFQVRYWSAGTKAVLGRAGEVLFLLHSTVDVTEAVLARQKVQESQERFSTLVAQAPVAIALTRGPDQVFESINASMLPVIGKEHAGEVIGKPLVEVLPELRDQPVLDLIRRVYQTGEPFQGLEMPVTLRMGGQLRQGYYNISYTPLRENGQITGVIHLAVEVTEQVLARQQVEQSERQAQGLAQELAAANEELRAANEEVLSTNEELADTNGQLTRTNQELDQYVYQVSHDIRSPVASILGLLGLIQQENVSPQVSDYLNLIENRISKLDEFITSVLAHSRSVNTEVTAAPIDFNRILDQCLEELQHYPDRDRLRVERQLPGPDVFWGDGLRLQILLKNLLSNAIKYRNPERDSFLTVRATVTPAEAVLVLEDNGQGIPAPYVDKVFGMFFRATDQSDGSGLGLYIVKQAVEKMGGSVRLTSQAGVGTAFTIALPNQKP